MLVVARLFKHYFIEARYTWLVVSTLVVLMRLFLFLHTGMPDAVRPDTGLVWHHISHWFSSDWSSFIAATICIFVIAWTMNLLNSVFALIRTRSSLPLTVPLLLFSVHPYFLPMSAEYLATIFLLLAFFPLLGSYQKHEYKAHAFKSGVLIGVASVFQIYAILVVLLWWRGVLMMRNINIKSFISFVLGILLVFWCFFGLYFYFDTLPDFIQSFYVMSEVGLPKASFLTSKDWTFSALVLSFFAYYMFMSYASCQQSPLLTQNVIRFMVFLLLLMMIFQLIYFMHSFVWLQYGLALLSFLVAYYYSSVRLTTIQVYSACFFLTLLLFCYLSNFLTLAG